MWYEYVSVSNIDNNNDSQNICLALLAKLMYNDKQRL